MTTDSESARARHGRLAPSVVAPPDDDAEAGARSPEASPVGEGHRGRPRAARASVLVLLAGGCFALVLALLLPFVVYPRLAVVPADPQALQLQTAASGTVLQPDLTSPAGVRTLRDVPIRVATYVSEAPVPADENSVVWRIATSVYANGNQLINARFEDVSIDKHSGLTNNCCTDRLFTDQSDKRGAALSHIGYITFPFDTQKRTYRLWDVQLRRDRPALYLGEERRDGFRAYKFAAQTPLTKIGTQELPGSLFGLTDPSVTADVQYADTRTFWVEPATGSVVGLQESLLQQFAYAGKTLVAIDAELSSPNLPKKLRDQTRQGAQLLPWLRSRASWVLVVAGLGLLLGWHRLRTRIT